MNISAYKFNLIYIGYVIIWPIIQRGYLEKFDGAGRLGWMMMLLAIFINKKLFSCVPKVMLMWGVWILYNIINSQIVGFYHESVPYHIWVLNILVLPFVTMLVSYKAFSTDFDKTLKYVFYTFVAYVFIGYLGMETSSKVEFGEEIERNGNVLGNTFINTSLLFVPIAFSCFYKKLIDKKTAIVSILLESLVVVLSGARKGILGLFVTVIFALIGKNVNKSKKQLLKIFAVAIASYVAMQFVLIFTVAGTRFKSGNENTKYADNWFLSLMGDRGFMYDIGWQMFLDNPINGIGLYKFRWENPLKICLPIHSEYMVQLCECGILGSLLFFAFYMSMGNRLLFLLKYSERKDIAMVFGGGFMGILLINLFAWTYASPYYFLFYGLIFAYYENNKR